MLTFKQYLIEAPVESSLARYQQGLNQARLDQAFHERRTALSQAHAHIKDALSSPEKKAAFLTRAAGVVGSKIKKNTVKTAVEGAHNFFLGKPMTHEHKEALHTCAHHFIVAGTTYGLGIASGGLTHIPGVGHMVHHAVHTAVGKVLKKPQQATVEEAVETDEHLKHFVTLVMQQMIATHDKNKGE